MLGAQKVSRPAKITKKCCLDLLYEERNIEPNLLLMLPWIGKLAAWARKPRSRLIVRQPYKCDSEVS
jgi:hypothetical protein